MKTCAEPVGVSASSHPVNFPPRALAVILLFFAFFLHANDVQTPYDTWIKPWTERPATSESLGGSGLKAVVSIVAGEKDFSSVTNMTPVQRLELAFHIKVSTSEVATNGACRNSFVSNTDAESGAARQLAPEQFQKLGETLAQLPDDHSQLPPAGRRVVVQVWENNQWRVRVYDGNKLPPEVKSLLDLLANPFDKQL